MEANLKATVISSIARPLHTRAIGLDSSSSKVAFRSITDIRVHLCSLERLLALLRIVSLTCEAPPDNLYRGATGADTQAGYLFKCFPPWPARLLVVAIPSRVTSQHCLLDQLFHQPSQLPMSRPC